jgi:hypothetical protein
MTTSGTATFNLDLVNIVEEAFERCGRELRTGYDMRTARRSLNLLTIEWANRGINLWVVEQGSIPMVASTANYSLPVDTIDLIDQVIRTGSGATQQDVSISRVGVSTYASIPTKTSTGRPLQFWLDRQATPEINVWPVPDESSTYTFVYWRLRRIQDAGASGITTQDIPFRFLPALVSGLAYHLSIKIAPERVDMLKMMYEEQFQMAADEDREKVPLRLTPARSW